MKLESIRRMVLMVVIPFMFDAVVAGVLTMAERSSPAHLGLPSAVERLAAQ